MRTVVATWSCANPVESGVNLGIRLVKHRLKVQIVVTIPLAALCFNDCRITDNLPCSTKIMLKNNEVQHEHGYRLGAVINDKVRSSVTVIWSLMLRLILQCFDTVGCVNIRASGLQVEGHERKGIWHVELEGHAPAVSRSSHCSGNKFTLSAIGWCRENFAMISLTFWELSCWQTNKHPDKLGHKQALLKIIPPSLCYAV